MLIDWFFPSAGHQLSSGIQFRAAIRAAAGCIPNETCLARSTARQKPISCLAMLFLRSLLFNIAFVINNALWFVLSLPGLLLPYRMFLDYVAFPWARSNVSLFSRIIGVTVEVRGRENFPQYGAIVAAKHQSTWETFFLTASVPNPTYILKRELLFIPLFGFYLYKSKSVPINRGKGSAVLSDMNAAAKRAVDAGRQLMIFPEGTRRPAGAEPKYKYGIAHLYHETGAPCIPVAHNAGLFWPRRGFLKYPGRLIVEVMPAIPPGLDRDIFFARVKDTIESASTRLIEEARKGTAL
jgi:1-acyl-sn-glycerol-3-phosphate acyltransferase